MESTHGQIEEISHQKNIRLSIE